MRLIRRALDSCYQLQEKALIVHGNLLEPLAPIIIFHFTTLLFCTVEFVTPPMTLLTTSVVISCEFSIGPIVLVVCSVRSPTKK